MEATLSHLVISLLSLLVALLSPRSAVADDTLSMGANLTDGKTLVSSDGTFILGFFSPGASTKRYLGIWFSGSGSTDAVVWVANRESPISDSAGALVVSNTGSLAVLDGSLQLAWSSNSTSTSPVEAQLLNSGNLVVRNRGSAAILWQSFDYPTNALLSGMKVGVDFWNRFEWHLTSWRSPDDPAPGAYRRVLDTTGLPDNVVWKGDAKTFRTGPWNGVWFSGIPEVLSYKNLIDYQMLISPREVTYGYVIKPGAPFTYVVLTETGDVNRLVWYNSTGWQTRFHGPRDVCDNYGKCGAFGMCNISTASTGFCSCLKGFSQVDTSDWRAGCRRDVMLDCGKGPTTDGFMPVPGVKLPDTHNASVDMNTSVTVEDCKVRCLASCSCVAYAAADIRGNGSGCIIWTHNLMDLRYVDGGQLLYLRLPKSELAGEQTKVIEEPPKKVQLPLILGSVFAAVVLILLMTLLVFLVCTGRVSCCRQIQPHISATEDGISLATNRPQPQPQPQPQSQISHVQQTERCCCFALNSLSTIRMATRDFHTDTIIGEGAFGIVYEGTLQEVICPIHGPRGGRTIAVKRCRRIGDDVVPERFFTREVQLMALVNRHANVLELLASCREDGEYILVYEYMHRRSLDTYIFGFPGDRELLNWERRLKIIKDIAEGVKHLSICNVIHRDLKPANVLLDNGWGAKVADFGTARLYVARSTASSGSEAAASGSRPITVIGTHGYMAPEYIGGETSAPFKWDIYSFGVTLLETLSGRRNSESRPNLISTARRNWNQSNPIAFLASAGLPPPSINSELGLALCRCIQIGLLCVQKGQNHRPEDMTAVVRMLNDPNEQILDPSPSMAVPIEEEDVASLQERWEEEDVASLQEVRVSEATLYETLEQLNNPIPYNE